MPTCTGWYVAKPDGELAEEQSDSDVAVSGVLHTRTHTRSLTHKTRTHTPFLMKRL